MIVEYLGLCHIQGDVLARTPASKVLIRVLFPHNVSRMVSRIGGVGWMCLAGCGGVKRDQRRAEGVSIVVRRCVPFLTGLTPGV